MGDMKNSAKANNRFMLFFILHFILMGNLFYAALLLMGKEIDAFKLQTAVYLLSFLPPIAFFMMTRRVKLKEYMYSMRLGFINFLLIIVIVILVQPILSFLSGLSAMIFPDSTADFVTGLFDAPLWSVLMITAVLPAFCEEFLFRGIFFDKHTDLPVFKKVMLSAFFFSLMHLNPQQFLYTFAAGVLFAYLVYITNSIFASILAHYTINSSQVAALFQVYTSSGTVTSSAEALPLASSVMISLLISVLAFPLLIFAFYLLVIYNKDKIAFDIISKKLRRIINQRVRKPPGLYAAQQDKAVENTGAVVPEDKAAVKIKIITWEFWGAAAIYIIYVVFISFITK